MRKYLFTALCLLAFAVGTVQADNLICPYAEGDNLGKAGKSFGTAYITGVASNIVFTNGITVNGDLHYTADAAGENINILHTAAAGTADTPFIFINDDRTGTTANTAGEASIYIDAEGSYAIAILDGILQVETEIDTPGTAVLLLDPGGTNVVIDGGLSVGGSGGPGDNNLNVVGTIVGGSTLDVDSITVDAGAGIDAQATGTVKLGESTADKVEIADTGITTDVEGPLVAKEDIQADEVDSENAAALILGKSTATSVEIADNGVMTDVQGILQVQSEIQTPTTAVLLLDPGGTNVIVDGGLNVGGSTNPGDNNLEVAGTIVGKSTLDVNSITVDAAAGVDCQAAGTLKLGESTADAIEIADTGVPTSIEGKLTVENEIDTPGTTTLLLDPGGTNVIVDGGLNVGGTTNPGDNNLDVAGTIVGASSCDVANYTCDAGAGLDCQAAGTLLLGAVTANKIEVALSGVETEIQGTLDVQEAANFASTVYHTGQAGTKTLSGLPITIVFEPTTGETLTWTVPTGYDLRVLNAVGWKTAAAAAGGDAWDIKNNDGSAANIFTQEAIGTATLADKGMAQFDGLDDAEDEVEAGNTLQLVATEDTDDDGADGIIYVYGILKAAD